MANSRELLRVGLPTRAVRLRDLLDALDLDHGSEATVRYHRGGGLVIEEATDSGPQPGLDDEGDDPREPGTFANSGDVAADGSDDRDKAADE